MEVMQYRKEEFAEEKEAGHHHQLREELEEVTEETTTLVGRRSRQYYSNGDSTTTDADDEERDSEVADSSVDSAAGGVVEVGDGDNNEDKSKNSVYLDQSAGGFETLSGKVKDVDIQKILSAVISGKNMEILNKELIIPSSTLPLSTKPEDEEEDAATASTNETQHLRFDIIDESDEEILELEFERAVEKMHTHEDYNMYCPNCSNRITKVILRKRKKEKRTKPQEGLGCLSCFSIFMPKGNLLNPLKVFGNWEKHENSQISQNQEQPSPPIAPASTIQQQSGGKTGPSGNLNKGLPLDKGISKADSLKPDGSLIIDIRDKTGETIIGIRHPTKPAGEIEEGQDIIDEQNPSSAVQFPPEQRPVPTEHTLVDVTPDVTTPLLVKETSSSHSLEILKSIVYGGLLELVASLSIVSSSAASHATTLNTVALGLANVFGGLIVLFHNLKDLRYEVVEGEKESRYQKLLGHKENYIVHTVFVVLSYIVFGLIPPVVFGFTFRETDDQDFKLVTVAAVSLVFIIILSIAKTFTRRQHTFVAYSKTVVYYVTGAATASGIAYAAGNLLERFMNEVGWFDAKPIEHMLIPGGDKNWASF